MEKLKGKYEVILGFITLVVSLSAFKEELSKVDINLGYTTVNLANYFLNAIYGLCICLYLYIIERITSETRIGAYRIFNAIVWVAYFLFLLILTSPILLFVSALTFKSFDYFSKEISNETKTFLATLGTIYFLIQITITIISTKKLLKSNRKKLQDVIYRNELWLLENAIRLFKEGFYLSSFLKTFDVLDNFLHRKLLEKNLITPKKLNSKLSKALDKKIITKKEFDEIQELKNILKSIKNEEIKLSKNQTEKALDTIKRLTEKPSIED